ncbi:related to COX18 Protein required for activity of mitochondrial cytochrome oxidase [Phialocephala subalpina]|uniref:Related to COX18 Protein required for activity of mitochondrial cytochrome oxidase n=1 Tax=Phialocephala subalpina TaxID=576137 RepID=A0A1L7XWI6_9HELO|nr:related to COX18 Protein required for activity of mitochondrial cytochrome oxidase [Phialocephala subalpina]
MIHPRASRASLRPRNPPSFRQQTNRSFHASPKPQFLAEAITASHSALQAVHSLSGLPWALSLPLFALVLRTTLVLPISIFQRRAAQKQVQLQPLIQSWNHVLRKETMAEYGNLGPSVVEKALMGKMRKKRSEVYGRWGCGMWRNWVGLLQMPIFLSVMEAIRKMTGSREGILGMFTSSADNLVEGSGGGDDLASAMGEVLRIPVETSLATEGMLWFPDLLVADPQLVLPFVLSGTILWNVFGGTKGQDLALPSWHMRMKRGIGFVGLLIGPIMLHVPSALLVYWISSSSLALLQAMILERVMPIRPPPKACVPKRPWRTGLGRPVVAGK